MHRYISAEQEAATAKNQMAMIVSAQERSKAGDGSLDPLDGRRERARIADIVQECMGWMNGWYADKDAERQSALKAAKRIQTLIAKRSSPISKLSHSGPAGGAVKHDEEKGNL